MARLMYRTARTLIVTTTIAIAVMPVGALAQVIIDRQPRQAGGTAADTEYLLSGSPRSQQSADDFVLGEFASIRRIVWWGFYNQDNPPPLETFRVRFHEARASDGLPGNLLHEFTSSQVLRESTGLQVILGVDPDEYRYTLDLPAPFHALAQQQYWFAISQIGSMDSLFGWEYGTAGQNGFAFLNASTTDWRITTPNVTTDLAFQLSTAPEPATIGLRAWGAFFARRRSARRAAA